MTRRLHDDVVARGRKTVVRRKRLPDAGDEYRWRSDPELARFDASRPVQTPFEAYERNWSFDYASLTWPAVPSQSKTRPAATSATLCTTTSTAPAQRLKSASASASPRAGLRATAQTPSKP